MSIPAPTARPRVRVLLVDDSRDITSMLSQCIEREPDMEIVGCLNSADDLVAEVDRTLPDVVLLDMTMPGKDPLEALREVKSARVIVFSGHDDQELSDSAAKAGACGFLSKDADVPMMLGAIREVARRAQGDVRFGVWR